LKIYSCLSLVPQEVPFKLALRHTLRGILSKMSALPPTSQMRHHRTKATKAAKPRLNTPSKPHTQFTKLQVISTFSSDSTTPSIRLLTQSRTYIFNCGEGMQRLCQVRSRLPRYSDIFLTRLSWDVAGGLPGTDKHERS
jgi:hypothetical protein